MKIALIQLDIEWESQKANYAKVKKLISEAKKKGAELVCLPELFSTGVTMNASKFAEKLDGKTCKFLSEQAKTNKIFLLGTFIEENPGKLPLNTAVIFNPEGKMLGKYNKNHVFTFGNEHKSYSNGDGINVFKIGDFNIASFICYDLRFPEIFRIAVDMGANLFVIPANWPNPRKEHWVTLLKARAIENQSYVIGINRCGNSPELSFFGSSMIISPKGEVISKADDKEQIVFGDINTDEVAEWRTKFTALKDRRKGYYLSFSKGEKK